MSYDSDTKNVQAALVPVTTSELIGRTRDSAFNFLNDGRIPAALVADFMLDVIELGDRLQKATT